MSKGKMQLSLQDICCLAFLIGKHFWRMPSLKMQKQLWFFTSIHVWDICSSATSKAKKTFVEASVRVVWEKLWSHTCIAEKKRKLIWRTYAMLLLSSSLVLSNASIKYDTTLEDVTTSRPRCRTHVQMRYVTSLLPKKIILTTPLAGGEHDFQFFSI